MDLSIQNLYTDLSLKYRNQIVKASEPLKDLLNIPYFSYQKVDAAGNYTVLSNNIEFSDFYLENKFYLYDPFLVSPSHHTDGTSVHVISKKFHDLDDGIKKIYDGTAKKFHFSASIIFIVKQYDSYEIYVFAMSDHDETILQTCLNQNDLLERFITHFKKSNKKLLSEADEHTVNIAELRGEDFNSQRPSYQLINQDLRNTFLETVSPEEHMLKTRIRELTSREQECLHWMIAGKTALETAEILNISRRTVETYREKSRAKLGLHYTFSNLCYLIGKYKLL